MKPKAVTSTFAEVVGGTLIVAMIVVGTIVGAAVVQGIVLSTLWRWFISTKFHLPSLSILEAIGITLTARVLFSGMEKQEDDGKTILMWTFVSPFIALFAGWVVLQFMR